VAFDLLFESYFRFFNKKNNSKTTGQILLQFYVVMWVAATASPYLSDQWCRQLWGTGARAPPPRLPTVSF